MNEGLGVAEVRSLQLWVGASVGAPNGKDLESVVPYPIVDPALRLVGAEPSNLDWSAGLDLLSNAGLENQQSDGARDFDPDGTRCGRAVLRPPSSSLSQLALGASLDDVAKRHA